MNKVFVFEHAGDLVNVKVAHNLMRLIAEGFGEDDEAADSQLRLSAVESYLQIVGEPKLPSLFLQVICWVLGEYGTADGKYSASYIIGKLYDVAEAYSSDDTVKAYAVTAIMKICAFELTAGRRVDVLPECQSLIEELSASHSTDLQQRAYEVQTLISLDSQAVASAMPFDASCEDIEVDKNLSFLDNYVQQALEKGAEPYIPESQRSGTPIITNVKGQGYHEPAAHTLKFEAYEFTKAPVTAKTPPGSYVSSTELVPVTETSYARESHQATATRPVTSDSGSNDVRLRLDGVQKKWGKPSYSSPSPSASNTTTQKAYESVSSLEGGSNFGSKARATSYDSRKQQVEISPEKQKLAASLFGGTTKSEKRSSSSHRHTKPTGHHVDKSKAATSVSLPNEVAAEKAAPPPPPPPPDLLDLGEPDNVITAHSVDPLVDPFKQLEGLLEAPAADPSGSAKGADILGLYGDMPTSDPSPLVNPLSGLEDALQLVGPSNGNNNYIHGGSVDPQTVQTNKGPNSADSLQKDKLVRQMGVTPTSQNPNLFKDLLG